MTGDSGLPRALRDVDTHLLAGAATVTALIMSVFLADTYVPADPRIAEEAGRALLSGDLALYAHIPEAQMGPLALLLAGVLGKTAYIVVVNALLYALVVLVRAATEAPARRGHLLAAVLVGTAWHRLALSSHADDVLVILGLTVVVLAQRRRLPWLAVTGFLVAIAGKPTAVIFLPLLFLVSGSAFAASVVGMAAIWAPFALADLRGFLDAGRGIMTVFPYSLPGFLGVEPWSDYPSWVRPSQLVGGTALCLVLGRRGAFAAAVVAGLAFRTALEPGTVFLYWQTLTAACFLLDVSTRRRIPVLTIVAFCGWVLSLGFAATPTQGLLRLGLLAAILVLAVLWAGRETGGSRSDEVHGSGTGAADDVTPPPDPVRQRSTAAVSRGP